jgi:hypothetical integral membrane protein (TIGR02206 family)
VPAFAATSVVDGPDRAAFDAFTATHLVVVVVAAVLTVALLRTGRSLRRERPVVERRLRFALAGSIVGAQVAAGVYWLRPSRFDPTVSLPLHVCDLAPWIAVVALLARFGRGDALRALTYFLGLGLSSWGFAWPVLTQGPATFVFWLFWIVHWQIVAVALYLPVVGDWRPGWRDVRTAAIAVIAYAVLITPVNLALDANYGYVGPGAGPADLLGPWPWRVPVLVAGEILIFVLLVLPWRIGARTRAT